MPVETRKSPIYRATNKNTRKHVSLHTHTHMTKHYSSVHSSLESRNQKDNKRIVNNKLIIAASKLSACTQSAVSRVSINVPGQHINQSIN